MSFTGTWALPAFTLTGVLDDNGNHGYVGEQTLPAYTLEGAFEEAFNPFTGDKTLPLFTLEGAFLGSGLYAGDFRLPRFALSGALANGNAYAGALTLPLFAKEGRLGHPGFDLTLALPAFSMAGRIEADVTSAFKGWMMNTRTGALTEYTNFSFNSFAQFNGETLAAGAGGLFALTGADDAGTDIDARVRLASMDLDMAELKRIEEALLSYRSDGRMILRVVVEDGLTYEYVVEPTGRTGIYQARVKPGKGLKLNYITLELANFEGAAFDFDALRIKPVALSRQVG